MSCITSLGSGRLPYFKPRSIFCMTTDASYCPAFVSDIFSGYLKFIRLGAFFCCMYDIRHTRDAVSSLAFFFPIFIFGRLFRCLSNRFSKERYHFTINDLVEAELTNAFAEAVGGESIHPSIEGSGNEVVINLLVSFFRVRTILQPINRIGELSELGVCDCEFDFFQ